LELLSYRSQRAFFLRTNPSYLKNLILGEFRKITRRSLPCRTTALAFLWRQIQFSTTGMIRLVLGPSFGL
jgi:hypothetical protein